MSPDQPWIRWFETLTNDDVPVVGGKNASLGEMIQQLGKRGVRVPDGFATTAKAYWTYLSENQLDDQIHAIIDSFHEDERSLQETGQAIRDAIAGGRFPSDIAESIGDAYRELSQRYDRENTDVAVRSSATAEDLPTASFAGQQETYLNVRGERDLLDACRNCFASLFTDRAISYRENKGFDHMEVALSVGVQKMVRSDKAGSGVMFTIDTDTGFPDTVMINAAWGLGENVVQGTVNPDEYMVYKPLLERGEFRPIVGKNLGSKKHKMIYTDSGEETTRNVETTEAERNAFVLSDEEILRLAQWGREIEEHYERPMDIEWAKDGETGDCFIVQARPETVQSQKQADTFKSFHLKGRGEIITTGLSIGDRIASGRASIIHDVSKSDRFEEGDILVTEMTQPDWVPLMKKAGGIITNEGGRTCHAAIVSRELGIPAVVGTGNATRIIEDGQEITLSCSEGEQGKIYSGILDFEVTEEDLGQIPDTETKIMLNMASPDAALRWWDLPVDGIGLARMEFIINDTIKIHPMALVHPERVTDDRARIQIDELTRGYEEKTEYFVDHLARGIAKIACSQYPDDVIVRMSDFKSNEYADLIGGKFFEPHEDNPMLGFRGAARYDSDRYREGFALECRAIRRVREEMGMENVVVMIPFCRTLEEADGVLDVMKQHGLEQGKNGLRVYVMAEIPSNIVLAGEFADRFDGFSIGSNDLTQLVLGIDRDSTELAHLFDESNEAVRRMVSQLIDRAHAQDRPVGICGQGPSDKPHFAEFLVKRGIDSLSLNPDSVLKVKKRIAELEANKAAAT